jgi:dihydrofolate synthase / folylpolyglutamate synthase
MATDPAPILARLESLGIRLGLDRTAALLAALDRPQRRVPAVLVAGSNGKGSTAALLAAMGTAAGYRTGLYTSPHLESVEERIRLDGRAVSRQDLGDRLARVVAAAERASGAPPTYFEALTAAAFLGFAEEAADLAVLEVGLGGRLDATNLADPVLSLVTPICLEHREYLGDTLAAIAREKAGIFRPGRPALASVAEPEAAEALRRVAGELGTPLRFAAEELRLEEVEDRGLEGLRVRLVTPAGRHDLTTALPGGHQAGNLALAAWAAETLAGLGFSRLGPEAIAAGAAAARWPGRLEAVDLPGGRRALLDAAHNGGGAAALAGFLRRAVAGPVDLLFGVLADKDAAEMLCFLEPLADRIVLTAPPSPRARRPEEVAPLLGGRSRVSVEPDLDRALGVALREGAETLVICGSIVLVGEARKRLRERFGVPAYINGS